MIQRLLSQLALPVLIVALGIGGVIWLSARDTPPQRVAKPPAPPAVETIALPVGAPSFPIQVNGNVVPRREVTLSAEVAGAVVVKGDAVESGRLVRKGAPLLQIDPARFELEIGELNSELMQVDADLRRLATEEQGTDALIQLAEREAKIATAASQRHKTLAGTNAVTDAERESVERRELQALNVLRVLLNERELIPIRRERLQAQRKLTELKQQQAQLDLDRTKIIAPFTGMVTTTMVERGDYVQSGDALLKLEETSAVDVECSLRMDDLFWLWNSNAAKPAVATEENRGAPTGDDSELFEVPAVDATVTVEMSGRRFDWQGKLARYGGGGVNRKTRTVLCRVRVPQPVRAAGQGGPPTLMRGMFVTVTLHVTPQVELRHIPARAVQPNGHVWTVDDGLLRGHSVQPDKVLADGVLVRADATDLKPGDRVVITQLVSPLAGSRVREIVNDRNAVNAAVAKGGDSP